MLQFSAMPPTQAATRPSGSIVDKTSRLQADKFVEAFTLLENDIIFLKDLLRKAEFIMTRFELKAKAASELFEIFLRDVFEDNTTQVISFLLSCNGEYIEYLKLFINEIEDSLAASQFLLRTIEQSLEDGSTLTPFLFCQLVLGVLDFRAKSLHGGNKKIEYILRTSTLKTIFELLKENLTPDELQITTELQLYYVIDPKTSGTNYFFDSKLYADLRGETFKSLPNNLNKVQFDSLIQSVEGAVSNLCADCFLEKAYMLAETGILSEEMLTQVQDCFKYISNLQAKDPKYSDLLSLLKFYEIKEELIQIKTTLDCTEVYLLPGRVNVKSLKVDFDKIGTPAELRRELVAKFVIIDTSGSKLVKAPPAVVAASAAPPAVVAPGAAKPILTIEPKQEEPKREVKPAPTTDAVRQPNATQASVAQPKVTAPEPQPRSIIRSKEEREQIAEQRRLRRDARLATLVNAGHKKFKSDGIEIKSDVNLIKDTDIQQQEKLFVKLFSRSTIAFTRTDANTIFASLNGEIHGRSGSHVSLFLQCDKDAELRFVGGSSFHGTESKCAEMHSLELLRNALYNHMSPKAIELLKTTIGKNNFYEPARRVTVTTARSYNPGS